MKSYCIGCSGYYYKDWKETFYPKGLPQKMWFEYYSKVFNTLELNVTFYRFPELSFLENWYHKSPDNFKFTVKAPRDITHYKKFNGEAVIKEFYKVVSEGLKEKLACVLFQLPPSVKYSKETLHLIIKNLDPAYKNVLEFRHESWWNENVYQMLSQNNISFCGMSHPQLPKTVISNAPFLYYRFHGDQKLYATDYSNEQLIDFAQKFKSAEAKDIFIYFNNTMNAFAINNAKMLIEILNNRN